MAQASASQPDGPGLESAPGVVQRERAAAEAPAVAASGHAAAEAAAVASGRAAAAAAEVVSGHAAAERQPEAASAAWVQRPAAGAAEAPDGSRAAEPAGEAASGVPVRQPAEVQRAGAVVQLPEAVRPVAWARQAAREAALPGGQRAALPLALPSEAASVFRQGPFLLSGPARPRAAARFAHELRSLQTASRSG